MDPDEELDEYEAAEIGGYDLWEWRKILELAPDLADTPIEKRAATLENPGASGIRYPSSPKPQPVREHKWAYAPDAVGGIMGNTGYYRCQRCGAEHVGESRFAVRGGSWDVAPAPAAGGPCR